jgi:hypothetical protein
LHHGYRWKNTTLAIKFAMTPLIVL